MSERQNQISELILTPQGGTSVGNVRQDQESLLILVGQGTPIVGHVQQDNEFLMLLVPNVLGRVQLVLGGFVDLGGNPIAFGTLTLALTQDATSPQGQLSGGISVSIPLDANGNIASGSVFAWPNSLLTPSVTQYIAKVYTASGQLVYLQYVTITNPPNPFNVALWVPIF